MAGHIGIAACSAPGAALCYTTICAEGEKYLGELDHPEVTMHTHSLKKYDSCYRDLVDWEQVGELMISSSEILKTAGADFVICPDNTIHQAFDIVMKKSPLPWLHIAEEVAKEAKKRGFKKLGVLGTVFLMEGPVYREKLMEAGLDFLMPEKEERKVINDIIFKELVRGIVLDESREKYVEIIEKLKERGCDSVALGCTEIPLLINDEVSPLPTLDSTRILARAALKKAVEM